MRLTALLLVTSTSRGLVFQQGKIRRQQGIASYSCRKSDVEQLLNLAPRNLRVCRRCKGNGTWRQKKSVRRCRECEDGLVSALEEERIEGEPKVAICGGGISSLGLALALEQRGIKSIVYERDEDFFARKPGYGLTLQQGGKALRRLGVFDIVRESGSWTSRHVAMDALSGAVLGEHGATISETRKAQRHAIHIPRQALRAILLSQLVSTPVHWASSLSSDTLPKSVQVVVGADGIRSSIRPHIIKDELRPSSLTCILGRLPTTTHSRSLEVFEFVDGVSRLYAMPYDQESTMWQLSFPTVKADNNIISQSSLADIAAQVVRHWTPLARDLIANTPEDALTGYPLYDRYAFPQRRTTYQDDGRFYTLVGDAAHPMLPFKAQGANQALLDSISLAQHLYSPKYIMTPELDTALLNYEEEMRLRSDSKVSASRAAGHLLHSPAALRKTPPGHRLTRAAVAKLGLVDSESGAQYNFE